MALLDRVLGRLIRHGRLTIIDPAGQPRSFGDGNPDWPVVTVRLANARAIRRILTNPRTGAAEAFMDGDLIIEQGDVMQLATLARGGKPFEDKPAKRSDGPLRIIQRLASSALRSANHRRRASANVAHHYDLDDRLYDRFLDPWRQYSCAYWRDDTPDLAAAQRAKIAHIAAKLALAPGQHVLDIGCGWGGLAIALHRIAGVRATGITLSRQQLAYAQGWARRLGVDGAVDFRLVDYRDVSGPYDRIVSVGMFEHVGVPDYPLFFRRCRELLTPDGMMLLHSIGRMGGPGSTDAFTRKYIFPGGYIPALSETLPAVEASRLIVADCEILRRHYAQTLRAWYSACVAEQDALEALFDPRFFRMWTFYLAGATASFEHGGMMNFQLQLTRSRDALPLTRDYMTTREGCYRAALEQLAGREAAGPCPVAPPRVAVSAAGGPG